MELTNLIEAIDIIDRARKNAANYSPFAWCKMERAGNYLQKQIDNMLREENN